MNKTELEEIEKKDPDRYDARIAAMGLKFLVRDNDTLTSVINSVASELLGDGPAGEGGHIRAIVAGAMITYIPDGLKILEGK